jgi:hypothetical protein
MDYDPETVQVFVDNFKKVDNEVGNLVFTESYKQAFELRQIMKRIISRILCNLDPRDIRPCHGSGGTACRTAPWDKYHKLRYYKQLDDFYSYSDHFFFSPTHLSDEYGSLEASMESKPQARVVFVPKDSRGPRVISCEPAELMYIQQGIMRKLYRGLESHPLTSGQINFVDQSINRTLAHHGSIHDDYCTIDLSEASDRVSWAMVQELFPKIWVEALASCRSTHTALPNGEVVELNKFAPMGSSCCFPIEALVFWACASAKIHLEDPSFAGSVYVYGDDIITESKYFDSVIDGLESIGLVANRHKSFGKGPFRESCGGDYHFGMDVTPIRLRKTLTGVGANLATCADLCNNIIAKFGTDKSTLVLLDFIQETIGYQFPRTLLSLPGTVRLSPSASNDVFFRRRYNKNLQRLEHRILSFESLRKQCRPPNWGEMLRKELSRDIPSKVISPAWDDIAHLEPGEYTVPYSVRTKWVWTWLG